MKKIVKIGLSIIGLVYLAVIIFVTGCLLFYNQYKVTQIDDKTFIIIDDKSDKYTDGDLVIFTKNPNDEIVQGDEIFFYEVTNGKVSVRSGNVTKSEKITDTETTFTINDNHEISSESVIGKTLTADVYPNVGKILYVFESRFGFLLLVILPALLFFFYELYRFVVELKRPAEDKNEKVMDNSGVSSSTAKPEPASIPEASAKPEPASMPEAPAKPEPASIPEAPAKPEPASIPEASAKPEPALMPEAPAKPEPALMPEAPANPEPASMPEAPAKPEPASMPEAPANPEPASMPEAPAKPEPASMPEAPAKPVSETEKPENLEIK